MAFHPDLAEESDYVLHGRVKTIGWIEHGHPFETGFTTREFRQALLRLISYRINAVCAFGLHFCSVCAAANRNGPDARSSQWAVYVPTSDWLFEAPSWIGHYVFAHRYRPPWVFQQAVIACPHPESDAYLSAIDSLAGIPNLTWGPRVSRVNPRPLILRSAQLGNERMLPRCDPILLKPIALLQLSPSAGDALRLAGIQNLGDLIHRGPDELQRDTGISADLLSEIEESLSGHGLFLGGLAQWPLPPDMA